MRLAWVGLAVGVAVVAGLLVRRASKRSVTVATANLPVSAAARVAIDELSLLGAPRVHGEDTTGLDVEIVLAGEPRVVVQDLAIDADGGVSGSAGNEFLVGILETGVRQIDASATSARMRFEHNILKAVAYVPPHAAAAHRDWFKTYNDWDYELTQREVDEMTGQENPGPPPSPPQPHALRGRYQPYRVAVAHAPGLASPAAKRFLCFGGECDDAKLDGFKVLVVGAR